ncbi:MAG: hypothetical protein FD126_117 [Elusimicrobia bacterium]|nr:MAG: hypothetical protein FD126_117 [Elusimicrobiota bacterium]
MERLRLPGSWRARLNLVGALSAAACAAGFVGLGATRGGVTEAFGPLYWMWVAGGAAGALLRLAAFLLERRGALEYVGEDEERLLRTRRLLTVRHADEPVRGCGAPGEGDDTPFHVKVFTGLAFLAWAVALPAGNNRDWEVELRFLFLWAAVVPSVAAVFFYGWHLTRVAVRLVQEASED